MVLKLGLALVFPVANLPFHCTLFEHAVTSLSHCRSLQAYSLQAYSLQAYLSSCRPIARRCTLRNDCCAMIVALCDTKLYTKLLLRVNAVRLEAVCQCKNRPVSGLKTKQCEQGISKPRIASCNDEK